MHLELSEGGVMEDSQCDHSGQLRIMTCELNHLSQPDGCASFSQGDSTALVAVYGPAEVKPNKELVDRATVEVLYKPRSGLPKCEDRMIEANIRKACESVILVSSHPRSSINIVVQEVQDSGSYLACCLNAACLALLDAGIPMKFPLAAVQCALDHSDNVILDCTNKQEAKSVIQMTFAFDGKAQNVISSATTGRYNKEHFQKCLVACREASKGVFQFYREAMSRKLDRT